MPDFSLPLADDPQRHPADLAADRIDVVVADITALPFDGETVTAIVNAANESLLGGGGVDGAIHRAAGPQLLEHNRTLGGCPTGLAKITPSFALADRGISHIIHTVGPIWEGDGEMIGTRESESLSNRREDVLLASCYQQCLSLASEHNIQSLVFPAISTGAYRFPRKRAAKIAFGHVMGWLSCNERPVKVTFCCFDNSDAAVYRDAIETREQWMFNRKRG